MSEAISDPAKAASIPSSDICVQLDRILKSSDFDATARERKFLSYVVGEELEGRGSRIKAYCIAVEVFGRDASFDPQNDPIVRIEAGHLRRSLERYYLTCGQSDSILIDIPKGGYVPVFRRRRPHDPVLPVSEARESGPEAAPRRRHGLLLPGSVGATFSVAALVFVPWFASTSPPPSGPEVPRLLIEPFSDLRGCK